MDVYKPYLEAEKLRKLPRTPCSEELRQTKILSYRGFKCKVYYNYVDLGEIGQVPANHWFAVLESCPDGYAVVWQVALDDEVKSLFNACAVIFPIFKVAVDRCIAKKMST